MSYSGKGGKGGKGGGKGSHHPGQGQKRPAPPSGAAPPAKMSRGSRGRNKGKGRPEPIKVLQAIYDDAMQNKSCLRFMIGQACDPGCGYNHFWYWLADLHETTIHWQKKDVSDRPPVEVVNSISIRPYDPRVFTVDKEESKYSGGAVSAQVASANSAAIIIDDGDDEQGEEVKAEIDEPEEEPDILPPALRQSEWDKQKRVLLVREKTIEINLTNPGLKPRDRENLQLRLKGIKDNLMEGQRRQDKRDEPPALRCSQAEEGLRSSTANEFRYILVPAGSWGEYCSDDDEAVPDVPDQGHILDKHTNDQIKSMIWLFYQLVQGLARPEGEYGKKGGVPRGENYPNPCFRCMGAWYCSIRCKYIHRHYHSLICHRHPAYLTAVEVRDQQIGTALAPESVIDDDEYGAVASITPGQDPDVQESEFCATLGAADGATAE